MSKKTSLFLVLIAFATDLLVAYLWYVALFPTEPITIFEATLGGALITLLSLMILALNVVVYFVALVED